MTDKAMQALTAEVTRTWAEFQASVEALRTYATARKVEVTKAAKANPAKLEGMAEVVESVLRANPGRSWHTQALAALLAKLVGIEVKTLQNVYLPALRATSPHCVRSGRQYLWYYGAAASAVSRDTSEKGA